MTQPSFLTRARTALAVFRNGLTPYLVKASPLYWPAWREGQPMWQIADYQAFVEEGFNLNALIYAAIMYKYDSQTSAPMRAYTGTREEPELLPENNDMAKLCARPNEHQGTEFPRLKSRGPIEAGSGPASQSSPTKFPRLKSRGPIEAFTKER